MQSKQTINPRTVLGFYATALGILFTATVAAVAVLATTKTSLHLIPWLLGFAGAVLLVLVGGVFLVTLSDPSKLMLGQISGTEYAEIRRASVIGDSASGEKLVTVIEEGRLQPFEVRTDFSTAAMPSPLPAPLEEDTEEEEEAE